MRLSDYAESLNLLGDENRLRLCALLQGQELCVSDLVRVTGIAQSRVSTHLGRLREAGFVRDRRHGTQIFYTLDASTLPGILQPLLDTALSSLDPTLREDRQRLADLEAERRGDTLERFTDDLERYYSPGRSWQSLAVGIAAFLELGDVLDVGVGDGAAASFLAPYCRSLTCVDVNPKHVTAAQERLRQFSHVRVQTADVHALPFAAESFDGILLFHTLTYAESPSRALAECARVLRPNGRVVLLCLDQHEQQEVTARYGERHPGFSPSTVQNLLQQAALEVTRAQVVCRETRKPHLKVVLALGHKRAPAGQP
jgi:SAM-dependent methyltransferase